VMTMKVSAEREVFSNGITNQLLVYWKMRQNNNRNSFEVDCGDQKEYEDMLNHVLKMGNCCNRN